jgi:hypothetical protein
MTQLHYPDDYYNLTVSVLIPTFNRPQIVAETVRSFRENLRFTGKIKYWISCDGLELTGENFGWQPDVEVLKGPSRGYGANMNHLLKTANADFILHTDDDVQLRQSLELDRHVMRLVEDPEAGLIRVLAVGSHRLTARLDVDYWVVDWESPDLYVYSNRPYLAHKRFFEFFGLHPEGILIGQTEEGYCHQCKNRWREHGGVNGPRVLVPLFEMQNDTRWSHIDGGVSWREKEIRGG